MTRTTANTASITFKMVMPAVTKALGEDRGKAFIANPGKETADEILEAARKNLYKLAGVRVRKGDVDVQVSEPKVPKTSARTSRKPVHERIIKFARSVNRSINRGDDVELSTEAKKMVRLLAGELSVGRVGDERKFLNASVARLEGMTERVFNNLITDADVSGDDSDEQAMNVVRDAIKWFRANQPE